MSGSFPALPDTQPFIPAWTRPQPRHAAPAPEALAEYDQSFKAQMERAAAEDKAIAERAAADEPCRCGLCPEPDPDCKDALLSCAPGVVTRMHSERVRNGEWDDIPAIGREAGLRVSKPAVDNLARIHANAEHGRLDVGLLLDRTPDLHAHQALAAGLRLAERVLAAQLGAWQHGEPPRTIAEMGAAVDITAAVGAERLVA